MKGAQVSDIIIISQMFTVDNLWGIKYWVLNLIEPTIWILGSNLGSLRTYGLTQKLETYYKESDIIISQMFI